MNLLLRPAWLRKMASLRSQNQELSALAEMMPEGGEQPIPASLLGEADFDLLEKIAGGLTDSFEKATLLRRVSLARRLSRTKMKSIPIGSFEKLFPALEKATAALPNQWLFQEFDDQLLPFYLDAVKHHEAGPDLPEHVAIELLALRRGRHLRQTLALYPEDIMSGMTLQVLLESKGFYLETPALVEGYHAAWDEWQELRLRTGEEFLAGGMGEEGETWRELSIGGQPARVVMDDLLDWGADVTKYWDGNWKQYPVLPFVQVFDLARNGYIWAHAGHLLRYRYDTQLAEKLVLPVAWKALIERLLSAPAVPDEDLIRGKSGGLIILCTGEPGTGKTLTAEVYAETTHRPLYLGRCSQLGTTPEALERNLTAVLERAQRWNAILLIDEADIYIHERGQDLIQAALVGVFLRLLEYYPGVLFLTSNRAMTIDDAILSRVTAHLHYELPDRASLRQIWQILAAQYGVEITAPTLTKIVNAFPRLSGRSVKQVIRLCKLQMQGAGKKLRLELPAVRQAMEFHHGAPGKKGRKR